MKIDNNKLIIRNHTLNLDEIALIGIQQTTSYEEFGFEDNYWLEFKLINGEKVDIETTHTQYEGAIVRVYKMIKDLLEKEELNQFASLGYMIVNLNQVQDIHFINKNKGIEIVFKDFHIDYPQLGKWRAKRAMKQYNHKIKDTTEQQVLTR